MSGSDEDELHLVARRQDEALLLLGRCQREHRILGTEVAADVRGVTQARSASARSRRGRAAATLAAFAAATTFAPATLASATSAATTSAGRLRQNGTVQARREQREGANEHEPHVPGARILGSRHHRSHLLRVADGCPARMPEYSRIAVDYAAAADLARQAGRQPGSRVPGSKVPGSGSGFRVQNPGTWNWNRLEPWNLLRPHSQIGPELLIVELRLGLRLASQEATRSRRRGNSRASTRSRGCEAGKWRPACAAGPPRPSG